MWHGTSVIPFVNFDAENERGLKVVLGSAAILEGK